LPGLPLACSNSYRGATQWDRGACVHAKKKRNYISYIFAALHTAAPISSYLF
jgi:hypothetical protein